MTQTQYHKILEILAYYHNKLCEANNIQTTNEYNYEKAKEMFETEFKCNGEDWLISLLKDKDE